MSIERKHDTMITIMVDVISFVDGPLTDEEILQKAGESIIDAARGIKENGTLGKGVHVRIRGEREDGMLYERSVGKQVTVSLGLDL